MFAKRSIGWSSGSSVWNRVVQKVNDKGGWRKTHTKETHSLETVTCWSQDVPNKSEEILRKRRDTCTFSPACGNAWHRRLPNTSGRLWNNQGSDGTEMLVLGKNWTTWFAMVSKYSGTINKKIEQGLRQKTAEIEHLRQSNQKLQAQFCHVRKSNWRLQTWFILRCFICRRRAGFKINGKRFSVRIWITYVCSHLIDLPEANRIFSQRCRVWNSVAWRRFTHGWFTSSSIFRVRVGNIVL